MKNFIKTTTVLLLSIILLSSCDKEEDKNNNEFKNELTFGSGTNSTNAFILTGVGTSFTTVQTIYFRLESAVDYNSNTIKLVVKKDGFDYATNNISSASGHILVTSYSYNLTGTYSVTGYITEAGQDKLVASSTFTVISAK